MVPRLWLRRVVLGGLVALLAGASVVTAGACSSSSGNGSSDGGSGSGQDGTDVQGVAVGPQGDNIDGPNDFDVNIPAGALGSTVVIQVSALAQSSYPSNMPALPSKWLLQSYIYSFQPHHQEFDKPVAISIPYNNLDSSTLTVLSAEPSGSWSAVSGADFLNGIASFTTTHFSFYAVVTLAGDTSASDGGGGNDASKGKDGGGSSVKCGSGCTDTGGTCSAGSCVCTDGYSSCDNACVNEQLDVGNCGGCGIACAESCISGECQVTLSSSESATALAVDATNLYWINSSGSVVKAGISGGSPVTLIASQDGPQGIALDAANVYWTTSDGNLVSIPKSGGSLITIASGQSGILGLAVQGANAYWGASDGTSYAILTARTASAGAGAPPTEVSSQLGGAQPVAIAVDASNVYWTTKSGLFSAPLGGPPDGGSAPQSLGGVGGNGVSALAIDTSTAYWGSFASGSGTVQKVALAGGGTTQLASGQFGPNGIATDGANVYWTTQAGLVLKLPVAGGTPTTLASVSNGGTGIVVDATTVYWASGNTVQKITPK